MVIFGVVFGIVLVVFLCMAGLIEIRHEAWERITVSIGTVLCRAYGLGRDMAVAFLARRHIYNIYQNIGPYIETLKAMRLAKHICFLKNYPASQDVEVFQFEICGINDEYKKDIDVLGRLLTLKLRDFYLQKLGNFAPGIYLSFLQEGEFTFWIAKNRYGDKVISDRMELDRRMERPYMQGKLWDMAGSDMPMLGWDLEIYEEYGMKKPIVLDLWKKPSGLITGASGSGKSYFVTALLNHILQIYRDSVVVYYCDFKSSEDTAYLLRYSRYFAGEKCADGLMAFYEEYQAVKAGERDGKLRLLFFDEWAGFQLWETQKSKKQAEIYKGMLQEILLMGRSLFCGAWVILQRPDSTWISGRENFHNICCFLSGGVSGELGRMISLEEEISDKIKQRDFFRVGEAVFRSDGEKTKFMVVGEIPDIAAYQRQTLDVLLRADGGAGSTEAAAPPS